MAKLQQVIRSNGSSVFSVNIPKELVELLGWEKGDELDISHRALTTLMICKKEGRY